MFESCEAPKIFGIRFISKDRSLAEPFQDSTQTQHSSYKHVQILVVCRERKRKPLRSRHYPLTYGWFHSSTRIRVSLPIGMSVRPLCERESGRQSTWLLLSSTNMTMNTYASNMRHASNGSRHISHSIFSAVQCHLL